MRLARLASLAVALGVAAIAAAAPASADSAKTRLPNGLVVLVNENPTSPVVAASLFVRVGARWETEADAGITNLLQHLLMRGTTRRSALEIALAAEDIGGGISAVSDADHAEIRGAALGRHWAALLELMADVALRPALDSDELAAERRQILRAIRNRQDQPQALAADTVMARLYGGHPYGAPPFGRSAVVERLDAAALRAHHERFYRAGRMILSVSGDVKREEIVAEAARLWAEARPGDGGLDAELVPVAATAGRVAVAHPSAQAQVMMAFVCPPIGHPDYAAMKVLAAGLGGGMGGRMFRGIRDAQGLAYSANALYPSRVGPSYLLAQIGTAPASAARAEEAMRIEVEKIRDAGIDGAELERARMYVLGQFALDRRTNARLAWYAAFFESSGVGHDFPRRYARLVEAVTAADVRRVAGAYLGAPSIVSLGPSAR
jgi:zinc protease